VSVIDGSTNPPTAVPPTAAGAVAPSGPIINDPLTDPSLSTSWPVVQLFRLDSLPSGLGTSSYRTDGFHIAIDHKSLDSLFGDAKSSTSEYLLPNEHLDAPLQAAGAGANQSIEVDAQQVAGGLDNQYGVACRMTSAGGYVLFAGSGGRAGIWKMRGIGLGVYTTPLEGFLADVQLDPDTAAKGYHLRADCNGTRLALFVNGTKVAEAQDGDFKSGHVGLYAYTNDVSGVDVAFTNLSISAPAAVPSSGEAQAGPSSSMGSSERVTLNGVGSILDLARFHLNGGNYSVGWTGTGPGGDSGDSDLIMDLIGMDASYPGQSITNTVVGSGETQSGATSASNVPAGQYYVRVLADGVWTVTISRQ
jgi:hypothetical protein